MLKTIRISLLATLVALSACGEEEEQEETFTLSCAVALDFTPDDSTTGDLSYCAEWIDVNQEIYDEVKSSCTQSEGTLADGALCTVAVGTQGCTVSDNEMTFNIWLTGSNWADSTTSESGICEGGTAIVK